MPRYSVHIMRNVQHSVCVYIRAKDPESAEEKIQQKLDAGVSWEALTKGSDVEEVEHSISIELVEEE
jgi:hypothetical protein